MSTRRIHPFPARMAPDIALNVIPEKTDAVLTVLDPMCGSGTVLSAALERGHNSIGIDIDPLAVMMSKLAITKIDTTAMTACANEVVKFAGITAGIAPWAGDTETDVFVNYWFAKKQRQQLIDLTSAISTLEDPALQLVLRLAVSRIIVTKSSQASLAQDTSHSRPHRVRTESDYDVYEGFQRSVRQLSTILDKRPLNATGKVELGDARDLVGVRTGSIDMTVTSPPYLNALDYLRGHKLALVWFGHKIGDIRVRRGASIGAERGLDHVPSEVVAKIVDVIESEAVDKSVLKRPMLERFAHDCVGFASELHRTLKKGGKAVLVVGNSTLKGNYIRNDIIAQTAMEHAGFCIDAASRYEREIPPSSRYMPINAENKDSSVTKRMRTEVVMTLERV